MEPWTRLTSAEVVPSAANICMNIPRVCDCACDDRSLRSYSPDAARSSGPVHCLAVSLHSRCARAMRCAALARRTMDVTLQSIHGTPSGVRAGTGVACMPGGADSRSCCLAVWVWRRMQAWRGSWRGGLAFLLWAHHRAPPLGSESAAAMHNTLPCPHTASTPRPMATWLLATSLVCRLRHRSLQRSDCAR